MILIGRMLDVRVRKLFSGVARTTPVFFLLLISSQSPQMIGESWAGTRRVDGASWLILRKDWKS
jgi:hypothetical protein